MRVDLISRFSLISLAFLALTPSATLTQQAGSCVLRIGLLRSYRDVKQITITSSSPLTFTRTDTRDAITSVPGHTGATLSAGQAGVVFKQNSTGQTLAAPSVSITPEEPSATLTIESPGNQPREYRGALEVSPKSGALLLVNSVTLEDYLQGVVALEMPASYPAEALKAQAVAARTYALDNRRKHASSGYELCDTTHCQVYGGATAEKPATTRAVTETQGITLTYNGRLASVMYSTDCGGATRNYAAEHPDRSIPYLCGVKEPTEIAHSAWEVTFTLKDLEGRLVRAGIKNATGLQGLKVTKTSPSGRPASLRITTTGGAREIDANTLKSILGLKSTMFSLSSAADGSLVITGKGSGHGVGLCQVGAKGLAQPPLGYSCDRILTHYFPGVTIERSGPAESSYTAATTSADASLRASTRPQATEMAPAPPPMDDDKGVKFQVRVKAPTL